MLKIAKHNNMSVSIVVQNNDWVIFFLPGRFLADVTKQVLSDLEASKYQVCCVCYKQEGSLGFKSPIWRLIDCWFQITQLLVLWYWNSNFTMFLSAGWVPNINIWEETKWVGSAGKLGCKQRNLQCKCCLVDTGTYEGFGGCLSFFLPRWIILLTVISSVVLFFSIPSMGWNAFIPAPLSWVIFFILWPL